MLSRKTLLILITATGLAAAAPLSCGDEDQDSQPGAQNAVETKPADTKEATKKPDLGPWWQKSSLDYPPIHQVLWHAAGSFSFMDAAGNTSGTTLDSNASLDVRKWRFTSHLLGAITRKRIVFGFGAGSADYDERTLREQVDFDLTKRVSLINGIEDYTNTLFFMDRRLNIYSGVGTTLLHSERHHFYFIAALGHASFVFNRTRMLSLGPVISRNVLGLETTNPSGGGAMSMQGWRWVITHKVVFTEDATYMQYFDTFLGHRWTINLAGDVPITKHLSFGPAYRVKEETNAIVHALTVQPQDRTFVMGFRLSI